MYTIDLLKGQGVPQRSRPEPIAAAALTIVLPVILTAAMLVSFFVNRVNISVARGDIARLQTKLSSGNLGEALKKQQLIEQEKKNLSDSLTEVASVIGSQTQWTPILETIITKLPQTVTLKAIDVKKENRMVTRPNPNEKGKTIETAVPVRVLHLSLVSNQQNNFDKVVKAYRESLLSDSLLKNKLDEIRVAQEFERSSDKKDIISYEMYLVFAPLL